MPERAGFRVPRCVCGHATGEHQSAGTGFPHPPRYGLCLVAGCPCQEFREPVVPKGETFVWMDGTIYDPALGAYRQATADELARNGPTPTLLRDFLAMPGVVGVEEGPEPWAFTLVMCSGCDGLARILRNANVLPKGWVVRERVLGAGDVWVPQEARDDG